MRLKKKLLAVAAAIGLVAGGFTVATPAQALTLHGYCYWYDACLYYRINYQGAVVGVHDAVADYFSPVNIQFLGANDATNPGNTDGLYASVGNATGSYWNADTLWALLVYEHRCVGPYSGWGRHDRWIAQTGSGNNTFVTRNNNRCQEWE